MADFTQLNANKVYGVADTGGDLTAAGDPSINVEELAKGLGVSIDEANKVKKQLENSLKSGYVAYGPESAQYMIDAQAAFYKQNAGKALLDPAGDGLYSARILGDEPLKTASIMQKTNDITMMGTEFYDPNATNLKVFYDASGKKVSPSALANTERGRALAAAGYDIGFGKGMIAPGVKSDTTAREARSSVSSTTVQTSVEQPNVKPIPLTSSLMSVASSPPPPPTKTAPIDTVLFNDNSMSIEIMTDLIFENIGGHELINIARNDIINGQQVSYTPIKNLGLIQQTYNPNNILRLQATSEKYFGNFSIKFEDKIPLVGNGPNGSNVYIDEDTGDLIIEGVNINKDELFEVEMSLNGTIYIANFGESTS